MTQDRDPVSADAPPSAEGEPADSAASTEGAGGTVAATESAADAEESDEDNASGSEDSEDSETGEADDEPGNESDSDDAGDPTEESGGESEGEAQSALAGESAGAESPDAESSDAESPDAESSDAKTSTTAGDAEGASSADGEKASPAAPPPDPLPAQDPRSTRFAAVGCVGLFVVSGLMFFVMLRSSLNMLTDPTDGMVPPPTRQEAARNTTEPIEEPRLVVEPRVAPERSIEWATSYEDVREAGRPVVVVFTASYATESLDLFEGTFADPEVEAYLSEHFSCLHIDLDAAEDDAAQDDEADEAEADEADEADADQAEADQAVESEGDESRGEETGDENEEETEAVPDPVIALCDFSYLPQVCYLDPRSDSPLGTHTYTLIDPEDALSRLAQAVARYEASE